MAARVEVEDESGEGYFASISDLMIGVLFVFLLMLTVLALNFRDAESVAREMYEQALVDLRKQTEAAQMAKAAAEKAEAEARGEKEKNAALRSLLDQAYAQLVREVESRQRLRAAMLDSLEKALSDRGVRVTIDRQSGVLRLSGDLLFETGQADFRERARDTVRVLAAALKEVLPCFATGVRSASCVEPARILETVLVEGHTDRQPYRGVPVSQSQAMNDELSTRRALAVFQALRQDQPLLDSLQNGENLPLLGVSGYGERRPLQEAVGSSPAEYERNRRIDVRFVLTSRTSAELEDLQRRIRNILDEEP